MEVLQRESSSEDRETSNIKSSQFDISEFRKDPEEYAKILAAVEQMEIDLYKPKQKKIKIKFGIQYETNYGERVCAIGGIDFMGDWDLNNALPLEWTEGNFWRKELNFKEEVPSFEYKYVVLGYSNRWEPGNNRTFNPAVGKVENAEQILYNLESNWQRTS